MSEDKWNPDQYLKFKEERTQPSRDLAGRIRIDSPRTILDVGCGPGNSTAVLRERWPSAEIAGLDSSAEMINDARTRWPNGIWILSDAATYQPTVPYDVVFSNAALQWIPSHDELIPQIAQMVAAGGAFAVQLPANSGSPLHRALHETAASPAYSDLCSGCRNSLVYHRPEFYYDLLTSEFPRVDMWESIYYHEMANHQSLVEWYKGTGMKPFLASLPDDATRAWFETEVLARARPGYPVQANGRLLYPFRRLFFVAYR